MSIIEEDITPELNTTPLESLPGNSDEFVNRPKKRNGIKTNKNTVVDESDSGDSPDNGPEEEEEDIEVNITKISRERFYFQFKFEIKFTFPFVGSLIKL